MQILLQNIIHAIRSLRTQAWQVAISSIGLAVGIVCLAFSANWFWVETNYDWFRPDHRNLYILQNTDTSDIYYPTHCGFSYKEIQEMKQQVSDDCYTLGIYTPNNFVINFIKEFKAPDSEHSELLKQMRMDTCAARLLGIEAIHGSIDEALATAPENAVITDKAAMKLFGRTDVVGELIQERYKFFDKEFVTDYTIKAVCAANEGMSNFDYDLITPLNPQPNDFTYGSKNFRLVVHTNDTKRTIDKLSLYRGNGEPQLFYDLKPLGTYPKLFPDFFEKPIPFTEVYFSQIAFTVISLLLVISAVANLIMVFTSINLARVREYALRRSMGATAWQNVEWILIGIAPTLLFAVMLSGVGMEWVLKLADIPWDTTHSYTFLYLTEAAVIALCLLGMAYPIWKMRQAYKASFLGHGDGGRSHLWLIVVQCLSCAFLLFLSLGMQRQISGMIDSDLGYDHKNMLRLHTVYSRWGKPEGYVRYYEFKDIFKDLPQEFRREAGAGIVDVLPMPCDMFNRMTRLSVIVVDENTKESKSVGEIRKSWNDGAGIEIDYVEIPYRAFEFFNIRTENGLKLLSKDELSGELQVCLNQKAMKLLAPGGTLNTDYYTSFTYKQTKTRMIGNSIGEHWLNKRIDVKDVVKVRTTDFFSEEMPTMIVGVEEGHLCCYLMNDAIYIKYADGRREDAEAAVRKVLRKFDVPEDQYMLTTFDEYIAGTYKKEAFVANLLSALTTFSVVITLAGVFSMLLYSLRLRRRSMAIHRVMGATFKDIFLPTLRPYLIYAVIGALIAYFPAYILMRKWMEYFHYGETPGVLFMFGILAAMCAIITLIVWWQVSVCMKEKPVEILKSEA